MPRILTVAQSLSSVWVKERQRARHMPGLLVFFFSYCTLGQFFTHNWASKLPITVLLHIQESKFSSRVSLCF